jgi:hypothetical protein
MIANTNALTNRTVNQEPAHLIARFSINIASFKESNSYSAQRSDLPKFRFPTRHNMTVLKRVAKRFAKG